MRSTPGTKLIVEKTYTGGPVKYSKKILRLKREDDGG